MLKKMLMTLVLSGAMIAPAVSFGQDRPTDRGNSGSTDRGSSDQGGRGGRGNRGGGGGNFDPAKMREDRVNRLKDDLSASDDEWKVLQPKLMKVEEARWASFSGFGGRGGRGFGGGGSDNTPSNPVAQASSDLRKTLENKDASAEEISGKLRALREAREKARAALQSVQKDLKEVLTARQEAVLVNQGMLE
jgi:hypothetical protein